MATELSAITVLDATLEWGASEEAMTKVVKITGIPDLGGEPNVHDVSTTEDGTQVNILGRNTLDSLAFEYFYDEKGENFKAVEDSSRKPLFYRLNIKGGKSGTFTWQGEHTQKVNTTDDDNPIKATITIVGKTAPKFNPPVEE